MKALDQPEIYDHALFKNSILLGSNEEINDFADILVPVSNSIGIASTVFRKSEEIQTLSMKTRQVIKKLDSFRMLKHNWDSHGAVQPDNSTVEKVVSLVKQLDEDGVIPLFVAPGPNGEILLEFKAGDMEAELYINADGSDHLLIYDGDQCKVEGTMAEHIQDFIQVFSNFETSFL